MPAQYGGFWRRFGATVIDYLLLAAIWLLYLLVMVISGVFALDAMMDALDVERISEMSGAALIFLQLWGVITWFGYFTFFHGAGGKTPGKMLMGVKVRLMDGREVTFPLAFLRTAAYLLSFIFFGVGYLWVLGNPQKRAWHDLIAGTVVMREEKHLDKVRKI